MTQRTRVLLQPAYVLHRRPYRDSSLLLDILTPQLGRVGLVARGARQSKSRSGALLQAFHPLLLSWSGSGELHTLNSAESAGTARWLTGTALMSGMYLNELLVRLLHRDDPHPDVFVAYETVLAQLAHAADMQLEAALRVFEKQLLAEIGYGLVLNYEAGTDRPIEAGQVYAYHIGEGPVAWRAEAAESSGHLLVQGSSLLDLARERLENAQSLRDAKRLMRTALAAQLGSKPLLSRRLFPAPT